jgi:HD domain
MADIQLHAGQIQVGVALPFDTFDSEGHLLLRKGFVIEDPQQLLRLLERGMFREAGVAPPPAAGPRTVDRSRKIPVIDLVLQVQDRLEALLAQAAPQDFSSQVVALVTQLQHGYSLDADAAIASIQVCHAGRYSTRRMVHGAILGELLLRESGADDAERRSLMCAALTMNIAMLDLQDTLYSQASPPSQEQMDAVHRHPEQGVERLRQLGVTDPRWLMVVTQHHETIDGAGYPGALHGAQICHPAQVLSVADRYGAMATGRAYRAAALPNVVLRQLFMDKDKNVAASLAMLLVKAVGIYPPGSLVELANGDKAIVTKRTRSANHPVVRSVKTQRGQVLEQPRKHLSSEAAYAIIRILPMAELGFAVDPKLLWDEGFEFDL